MKTGVAVVVCCIATLAVAAGCSKKDKGQGSKDWPDRPLVEKRDTVKGIAYSISVPKGVGSFRDPNVHFYRQVSPTFAFFIKVMKEAALPDKKALEALKAEVAQEPGKKLLRQNHTKTSVEVVVQEAPNKRHTVLLWTQKGGAVLKCHAFLGQKIGGPAMVKKSNAWILKICRSLKITAP